MSIQIDNIEKLPATADKDVATNNRETVTICRTPSKLFRRRSIFRSSKARESIEEPQSKAQDWPNAIGFKFQEDVTTPVQLEVIGEIPDYVRGILYRIGPGGHEVETENNGTFAIDHWFDGLSQVHRFNIIDSKSVTYNSRHTCDSVIEYYRQQGGIGKRFSFGQGRDPCKSVLGKFISVFKSDQPPIPLQSRKFSDANINVTVSTDFPGLPSTAASGNISNLYAKTDTPMLQALHPETLEPVGLANQECLHPSLKGQLSAAHARSDPVTGDIFNFNCELGKKGTYRVFKVCRGSGKTTILATIRDAPSAYIHSFFLTKKYVILCVWNSHFSHGGCGVLWHKNILDALKYADNEKARFYVIDRTDSMSGVVGVYESEPFFAFHTINAWEEERADGADDVICEVTTFSNLDILKKFYFHNLLSNAKQSHPWLLKKEPRVTRWRLGAVGSEGVKVDTSAMSKIKRKKAGYSCGVKIRVAVKEYLGTGDHNFDLPTINPEYLCKSHRYTYGLNTLGASTLLENLIKYDSQTRTIKMWSKAGHTPSEPIFIPNPHNTGAEDDGVLLTVVLDGHAARSYLLCLDARDLKEVARAEMNNVVGFGFHGKHIRGNNVVVESKGANEYGWAEW